MNKGDIITIELTFVNAFLVRVKEGYVLIDSGLGMHWTKLENELISYGCLPDKLKLVIMQEPVQNFRKSTKLKWLFIKTIL
jgi:glyoxylase-like metal-dependent hydrolase (beta-lactamase superfamily II)